MSTRVFVRGDVVYHPIDKIWGVVHYSSTSALLGWWSNVSLFAAKTLALKGTCDASNGYYSLPAAGFTLVTNDNFQIQRVEGIPAKPEDNKAIENLLPSEFKPGYHLTPISKGKLGEVSKIVEEVTELQDASDQGIKVMVLAELADLYGAMDAYLNANFPGITMTDLAAMAIVTKRAFDSGDRK